MLASARLPRANLSVMHPSFRHASLLTTLTLFGCSSDKRPPSVDLDATITLTDLGSTVDIPTQPIDTPTQPADTPSHPTDTPHAQTDSGTASKTLRPLSPFSGSTVRTRRPTFRWTALSGTTAYRVQFSTTRSFATVDVSLTASSTELHLTQDLPVGHRWWRVVPIVNDTEGTPSVAWPITLGRSRNDLNGDGLADIAVGAPTITTTPPGGQGRVDFFTGPTPSRAAVQTFSGSIALGQAGASIALGDLDGDGFAEAAVGAPFESSGERVYVLHGGTTLPSTAMATLSPPTAGLFGRAVVIPGDLDGDGYSDLVVGAPSAASGAGRVWVYLGGATFDTTPDLELVFSNPGDQLGRSISGTDLDGDGFTDLIVSAHTSGSTSAGAAYVYYGGATLDATVDIVLSGSATSEYFGSAVAGLGDFDGDGFGDFAVSAPPARSGSAMVGRVAIYRGSATRSSSATPAWELHGQVLSTEGEELGRALAGLGDINNDGYADLGVGAPANATHGSRSGAVHVYLGGTSPSTMPAVTFTNSAGMTDASGNEFGQGVVGAGDINGDGFDDILTYAPNAPTMGRGGPGSVYLFSGQAMPQATTPTWTAVGTAVVGRYGEGLALLFAPFTGS